MRKHFQMCLWQGINNQNLTQKTIKKWTTDLNRHFYIDICTSYYFVAVMEYVQFTGYFGSQFGAGSRAGLGFSVPTSKAPTLSPHAKESTHLQPVKDQVPNTWVCREHLSFMPITEIYKWPIQKRRGWYNYINPPQKKSLQRWPTSVR